MTLHFIAIGGSAMHNLAIALQERGDRISGSDDMIYEPSASRLRNKGLFPEELGWHPERINPELDGVILGMHARADNPELLRANDLGLRVWSYPQFLYEQSRDKTRVVIGGSHGKTTITSMVLHVMKYHQRDVDYMVGAQLRGFETMVSLSEDNDFIVLEGDEYLASPVDRRPKFHLYKPNIALISGIAWDHVNVFPTFESYVEQFRIFIDSIVQGGILVYNEEDPIVRQLAEETQNTIRRHPYRTAAHQISNGQTLLQTPEGEMPIQVFGAHNLQNLAGAKWICQHMGVDEADFYEAIASFAGASKRLEKLAETGDAVIYKDFAHSPSKVSATTNAVKNQYPDRSLVACLELNTFSSLNREFLKEYSVALEKADVAAVYFAPETVAQKKLPPITREEVFRAFGREDLHIFTDPADFRAFLGGLELRNSVLLLMSSGNYGGLDMEEVKKLINR